MASEPPRRIVVGNDGVRKRTREQSKHKEQKTKVVHHLDSTVTSGKKIWNGCKCLIIAEHNALVKIQAR